MKLRTLIASFLSVCAIVLLLITTTSYGAGLQWDSVGYTVAARHFFAGYGWGLVYHVPVYPFLLAMTAFVSSTDPTAIAHWLNMGLTVALIFLAVNLLARASFHFYTSSVVALLGVFVVSQPLFFVSQYALSELLFVTLCMFFILLLIRVDEQPAMKRVIALAGIAAVVSLTRYVGIILLPLGLLALWDKRKGVPRPELLQLMLVYVLIAALPQSLWFLKNIIFFETLSGERYASTTGVLENLELTVRVIGGWFYPRFRFKDVDWMAPVIGTLLPLAAIAIAFVLRRFWTTRLPYFLVLFFLSHTAAIILVSSLVLIDPIADRLLAPSAVPLGMLIAYDISLLFQAVSKRRTRVVLTAVVTLFLISWIGPSAVWVGGQVHRGMTKGVPGYQSAEWQDRPTLKYLVAHQNELPRNVFTNEWPAVHLHTRMYAAWMPSFTDKLIHRHLGGRPLTLVLFFNNDEWSDPGNPSFLDGYDILREKRFEDGRIIVVQKTSSLK